MSTIIQINKKESGVKIQESEDRSQNKGLQNKGLQNKGLQNKGLQNKGLQNTPPMNAHSVP
jgi:hypothetical protein